MTALALLFAAVAPWSPAAADVGGVDTAARAPVVAVRSAPEPPPAPVTVNEFLPEDQNLGDCVGALERPGCGSKARGGWRQTTVFAVMALGLVVVFGRVGLSIHRNRR